MKTMMLAVGLTTVVWGSGLRAQRMSYSGIRHHLHAWAISPERDRWNPSPLLVELTDDGQVFAADDLLAPALAGPGAGRNLPQDLHGIELGTLARDPTTVAISFDAEHTPPWDDLYAQSFTIQDVSNVLHNVGMLSLNLAEVSHYGSDKNRILIPDAVSEKFIIPAPAGVLLSAWGILVTGWLRIRRWL